MKVPDVGAAGRIDVSNSQSGYRAYGKKAIEKILVIDSGMPAGSDILMQAKDHVITFEEVEIQCNINILY